MEHDRNGFLACLGAGTREAVRRAAERLVQPNGTTILGSGQSTANVYFIEAGFVSVIVGNDEAGVEVGLVGREGMLGGWLALGIDAAPFSAVARTDTGLLKLSAADFRRACADHPDLRDAALADQGRFTGMVAETCRAQAKLSVEARLARWLLLAQDRLDGDTLAITHDALAGILSVRRPGVTVAMHVLEGEHMLKATRGHVRILDREKLARAAAGVPAGLAPGRERPTTPGSTALTA